MSIYRVTDSIPVMLKEDSSYVSRSLPRGAIISTEEVPIDFNQHVIANWKGKDTLMFARELVYRAERVSEDASGDLG